MNIHLPEDIAEKLIKALKKAGSKEIGGILMGEYLSPGVYRVKDLTIQSQVGTTAFFLRMPLIVLRPLQSFFQNTNNQFTRFNYLGEWHSHPSYSTEPSSTDYQTMWEIVEDSTVGANFAVLIIVKLDEKQQLEGSVTVFIPNYRSFRGELIQ
ncbi:Mov34/MPN/PAD-1 family protein [Microcoleus sp. Pol11C3]|uniref:Mov34/MPN/PAD-1 family protein n=1 Tax=Microcoleus sp. Pol11C3 TaxID=3055390 RepID=UPI002FD7138C